MLGLNHCLRIQRLNDELTLLRYCVIALLRHLCYCVICVAVPPRLLSYLGSSHYVSASPFSLCVSRWLSRVCEGAREDLLAAPPLVGAKAQARDIT